MMSLAWLGVAPGRIVLVWLDVGLHVLRRHQPNLMPELRQLTRPMVRCRAGFHADKARCQSFKELYHLAAAELLSDAEYWQNLRITWPQNRLKSG